MKKKPVLLGKSYEITITGLSHKGEGIGRVDDFAVFIQGAIPGEKILTEIVEVKKNFARGNLKKILTPSADRLETPCPMADLCGGCQLQHITYKKQLELKRQMVVDCLNRLGGINIDVLPTLGMDYPWRYRNKGHFHVGQVDNQVCLGFYEPGTHDFVPARKSLLFSQIMNKLINYIEEQLTNSVDSYKYKDLQGYLKNVLIRESQATGEIMIMFITKESQWKLESILDSIIEAFPQVVSIYQNINNSKQGIILGREFKLLRGQATIQDTIGPYIFKISPQSFFQVNNQQTKILYKKALEYAKLTGQETVIDAYCGIGTISLFLAKEAKKVYGIEVIEGAIKDAKENARLNKINNAEFIMGKVEKWLPNWVKDGGNADVIVVDPPRKGCAPEVLEAIVEVKPERVVYVSCNPATLARDLKYLVENSYEVKEVQPIDMFPQTSHVECVTLMSRVEK